MHSASESRGTQERESSTVCSRVDEETDVDGRRRRRRSETGSEVGVTGAGRQLTRPLSVGVRQATGVLRVGQVEQAICELV